MKRLMFAAAALVALGAAAEPVRIIFDTDMICDFDDVGALACLHALADAGECEILATVSSTRGNASVGAIQVINAYYGRAHLPVGAPKGKCVLGAWPGAKEKVDPAAPLGERPAEGDGGHYKYRKLIRDWPEAVTYPDADDAPDATSVYRRALASAPDRSVVVCSVGFTTNLRRLLETPPDDLSPLDGKALVARKVVRWVAMACSYPDGLEYNAEQDAESTRIALAEWPTPIVFSDFQYGYDVYAGRAVADLPGHNPVRDVFEGQLPSRAEVAADPAKWRRVCYGAGGRSAWDETAVLAAVRGIEPYFNVRRGTYRIVGPKGEDEWVPDYDSPYLLERHRALLNAFAAWLEGTVTGTDIQRKDVIYGIEARYAGYWGEGAMRPEHYPKTDLLDAYAEAYVQAFPDTLICMGGHETLHLPTRDAYVRNPADAAARRAMTHVGKVFRLRNRHGPVGFFIDSWQSPSDQYDADSPRVLFGAQGEVQSLAEAFFGTVYRQRYVTGEFGYLTFLGDPKLEPYEKLPEQVAARGVSGLTLHNFTAKDRASLVGVQRVRGAHYLPGGIPLSDATYARVRHAIAAVGYRLVLGSPKVVREAAGVRASFTLTNVGVSRLFHDYNRIHLVATDADGRLVEDRPLDFRLGSLAPAARPLVWDEAKGARFSETFPPSVVEVRVRIPDEQGIEHPLCLSNRGRDATGAYSLGRAKEGGARLRNRNNVTVTIDSSGSAPADDGTGGVKEAPPLGIIVE